MRSVRCDACGTKALMAASKCPKCRNPIEIRDGFGELMKMAHCASCDSYYPETLGSCKWCGTRPERVPVTPLIWKAFGVLAFVAMAWGAWLVHDDPTEAEQAARMKALLKPDSSSIAAVDSAAPRTTTFVSESGNVVVDTNAIPTSVVAAVDSIAQLIRNDSLRDSAVDREPVEQVALADSPVAREPEVEPVPEPMPVERPRESRRSIVSSPPPLATRSVERRRTPAPTRVVERAPKRTVEKPAPRATKKATSKAPPRAVATSKPPARAVAKSSAPSTAKAPARKYGPRWVTSVSRNWVIVRASASPGARIIASVGPNTRVQLGESRGGWRRIKAKGLAGWVEHRLFYAGAGTPRGSRLAAR